MRAALEGVDPAKLDKALQCLDMLRGPSAASQLGGQPGAGALPAGEPAAECVGRPARALGSGATTPVAGMEVEPPGAVEDAPPPHPAGTGDLQSGAPDAGVDGITQQHVDHCAEAARAAFGAEVTAEQAKAFAVGLWGPVQEARPAGAERVAPY